MAEEKDVIKPASNAEKFKPQNVQDDGKGRPETDTGIGKDLPRGAESEVQRKSLNRS